jgi:hypothetical protein
MSAADRYDVVTPRPGKDGQTYWMKIGAAFPSKDGEGFTISLDALPLPDKDGKVWLKMSKPRERTTR